MNCENFVTHVVRGDEKSPAAMAADASEEAQISALAQHKIEVNGGWSLNPKVLSEITAPH